MTLFEPGFFLQPSIFMQRIGHLRVLLSLLRGKRRTSLERLASSLGVALFSKVPTSEITHGNLREWIDKRQQRTRVGPDPSSVHLQDAYLSDPRLPSLTGTVTPQTTNEVIQWAVQAGLIRRDTGTLSGLGELLETLEEDVVGNTATKYQPVRNPYLFSEAAGSLLIWALVLLSSDLKALTAFLPRLPVGSEFDRSEAGDLLADALAAVLENASDQMGRHVISGLRTSIAALERQRGTPSRGVREHLVAVRLEPLVDLGILKKKDAYRWRYYMGAATRTISPELVSAWPKVSAIVGSAGLDVKRAASSSRIWGWLYKGFQDAQSPVRFAGLDETILAGLYHAANSGEIFEWQEATDLISRAQRSAPKDVRFNVDRYGKVRHIRLPEAMPETAAETG